MNINIRTAQPDDVQFALPLIYSSGPHELDYVLHVGNKTPQDYLAYAFRGHLGGQSHRMYRVATVDNQVVGIGAFQTGRETFRLNLESLWPVVRVYGLRHILTIAQRSTHLESIIPAPEADAGFISQLGVREEFRGCGIGTALIEHFMEMTRGMGLRKCVLDVAMTNPRAQALYERLGFKVVSENPWKYAHSKVDVPGQRRMERLL